MMNKNMCKHSIIMQRSLVSSALADKTACKFVGQQYIHIVHSKLTFQLQLWTGFCHLALFGKGWERQLFVNSLGCHM